MDLAGDEKRIQALFSELSRQDAQVAPDFAKLWRTASVAKAAPRFSKSLIAVAATVIVAVAVLLVTWSLKKSPVEQRAQIPTPQPIASPEAPQTVEPDQKVVHRRTPSYSPRRRTLVRRQQRERLLAQQAALLANWKSPTEQYMTAPTRSAFGSLPQLNESAKELETFLSKKESNQ